MIARLWPWVAAIVLFCGIGFFVSGYLHEEASLAGRRAANDCFVRHGYTFYDNSAAPRALFEQCYRPAREAEGETWSLVVGGGGGLLAALLLLLAGVFGWRRATTPEVEE